MTNKNNGHCVCSISKCNASTALQIAAKARRMVDLLTASGEHHQAEELEVAFTAQLFIMAGKATVPLTIERKNCEGNTLWLYSLEQGFHDFSADRHWVVPIDGERLNRRITL